MLQRAVKRRVGFLLSLAVIALVMVVERWQCGARLGDASRLVLRPQPQGTSPTLARHLLDEEPIHIMMTFCIRFEMKLSDAGLTSLRSLLAARETGRSRNRRYVVHLALERFSAFLVNYNLSAKIPWGSLLPEGFIHQFHEQWGDVLAHIDASGGRVELRTYIQEDFNAAVDAALGKGASQGIDDNGFKQCSPMRLKAPFGLGTDVRRLVYLDLDTVVLCDIEELWDSFDTWPAEAWFGVASGSPKKEHPKIDYDSTAHLHRAPAFTPGGMNAGVLLMYLARMREPPPPPPPGGGGAGGGGGSGGLREYWAEVTRIVADEGHRAPRFNATHRLLPNALVTHHDGMMYYDQDILEVMSFDWPERFVKLDQRYNWFWIPEDARRLGALGSSPVCIEHYAAGTLSGYRDPSHAGLFAYWRDSRRIANATQMLQRRVRSATVIYD